MKKFLVPLMSIVVPAAEADKALEILRANGEDAYVIGEIVAGGEKGIGFPLTVPKVRLSKVKSQLYLLN